MPKKAPTAKTHSQPRAAKRLKASPNRSFEAMARAAVARASVIPSVTDILDADEEQAMIEAYIDQHCSDDSKQELRAHAKAARDGDHSHMDIVWIREEIAYALGVEVGRRLVGALNAGGDQ